MPVKPDKRPGEVRITIEDEDGTAVLECHHYVVVVGNDDTKKYLGRAVGDILMVMAAIKYGHKLIDVYAKEAPVDE